MIHTPKTQAPYKKQTSILSKIRVGVISTILIFTGIITACSDEANTAGNSANNKEVIKIGTYSATRFANYNLPLAW